MAPARMKRCFALVLLAACGGASPATSTPAPPTAAAPEPTRAAAPLPKSEEARPAEAKPADAKRAPEQVEGPLRWSGFPGPDVKPPVESGVAFVVAPMRSSTWGDQLAFFEANIVRMEGNHLVVEGLDEQLHVPGAFVAPPPPATALKVGAIVRFQTRPGQQSGSRVGRIAKVTKTPGGVVYSIKNKFIDDVETYEVPAAHVRALDGTLGFGAFISFELDGQQCFAKYIAPGREAGSSWVLSVSRAREKTNVKPLVMKPFAKGAKVRAVFGTTSVMKGGVQQEPRQYLEDGTVVEVVDGGLAYKVKDPKGEITTRGLDEVFAR